MVKPEDIGKGTRLKFKDDSRTYYSIWKHANNKMVRVDDGKGTESWKPISKIVQIENKRLNEDIVLRMQKLAGIIK